MQKSIPPPLIHLSHGIIESPSTTTTIDGIDFYPLRLKAASGIKIWYVRPEHFGSTGIRELATSAEAKRALAALAGAEAFKARSQIPKTYFGRCIPSLVEQARFLYFVHPRVYKGDWKGQNITRLYPTLLERTLEELSIILGEKAVSKAISLLEEKRTFKGLHEIGFRVQKIAAELST